MTLLRTPIKFLILFTSLLSFANSQSNQVRCENKTTSSEFILKEEAHNAFLKKNSADSMLEAELCESKDKINSEVKVNIQNIENVVSACVFIVSDDGSADLLILRKKESGYFAELKFVQVGEVNLSEGLILNCK